MPNQYTKAKELGITYKIAESTRKKLSAAAKKHNEKIWSDSEFRKKHKESMRRAVEKYPESYTSSNRGRTKQVVYKGIKFQGSWELEFYKWCEENYVAVERCNECFDYEWNGNRKYFPDFYLKDLNTYVEVKGYKTDRDEAKWSQFPKDKLLAIVDRKVLDSIRNRTYNINMLKFYTLVA